jgi:hypothetical protein
MNIKISITGMLPVIQDFMRYYATFVIFADEANNAR